MKDNVNIISKIVSKNGWRSSFTFSKINCTFNFNQNINRKNSILEISLEQLCKACHMLQSESSVAKLRFETTDNELSERDIFVNFVAILMN